MNDDDDSKGKEKFLAPCTRQVHIILSLLKMEKQWKGESEVRRTPHTHTKYMKYKNYLSK